jgi:hypothetical protein
VSSTADGTRRGREQLFGETERLIGKPSQQPSEEDILASLTAALFLCPLSEWDHGILQKNRLGLRLKEEIFYQTDGCIAIPQSLAPVFVEQFCEETHLV